MTEQEIQRLLGADLSAGTETFREALLTRCLAVLPREGTGIATGTDLDDEDLGLLAAAGDMGESHNPLSTGDKGVRGVLREE